MICDFCPQANIVIRMSEQPKFRDLTDLEWASIIKELTLYAHFRLKFWGLLKNHSLKGFEAGDIALKAIEAVLSGEWRWDPEQSDLLTYLKYHVVRGIVANLARNMEVTVLQVNGEILTDKPVEYNQEDELNSSMVMDQIRELIKDDDTLVLLVDELSNGLKRADICKIHRMSPSTYDNALRRLRTRLLRLQNKNILNLSYGKNKP